MIDTKRMSAEIKQQMFRKTPRHEEVNWKNQKEIYCFETSTIYKSVSEASRITGCSRPCILDVCRVNLTRSENNLKNTKGYRFQFVE